MLILEANQQILIYSNVEAGTTTSSTRSNDDHGLSYNLDRFLSEPNHTPGYGPAQSSTQTEKRMSEELRKFETKFSSSSGVPQRN